jgi:hypothetical protein
MQTNQSLDPIGTIVVNPNVLVWISNPPCLMLVFRNQDSLLDLITGAFVDFIDVNSIYVFLSQ